MMRGPRIAALLLVALAAAQAHAGISLYIQPSWDLIRYSEWEDGDKPLTPEPECPSGWTCAAKGDGSQEIDTVSASSFFMLGEGSSDEGNLFYAYKSCGTGDCQIIARVNDDFAGHVENFTGFGVGFTEGTGDAAWYVHNWLPQTNTAPRCKWGTPGPDDGNDPALDGPRPEYLALQHNDAANTITCWRSNDGITWINYEIISRNVAEPLLAYVFGTSQEDGQVSTATLTDIAQGTTLTISGDTEGGGGDPHVHVRDVFGATNFETGAIQPYGNLVDGVYTDNPNVHHLIKTTTFTITDVTDNSASPIITWTGTDPVVNHGFYISSITSAGMAAKLGGHMYRCKNVNAGANTCELWQDENDANKPYSGALCRIGAGTGCTLPNNRVSTVGLTWAPGDTATAQLYTQETFTNGCCGPSSGDSQREALRVVEAGHVPLGNTVDATPDAVTPLHGDFMLSSRIWFRKPYDEMVGSGQVNQRNGWSWVHDAMDWDDGETVWYGFAVYLPTNYAHNAGGVTNDATFDNQNNMIFVTGEKGDFDDHMVGITISGGPTTGSDDRWFATYQKPDGFGFQNRDYNGIGEVTGDIGHWTCFVQEMKYHLTAGVWRIWKQPECENAEAGEGLELVFTYTGPLCLDDQQEVNECTGSTYHAGGRQYKYSWNNKNTTTDEDSIEVLYDDVYFGRASLGQGFSDVHAHGAPQP